jgi:UDP-N-acetylglucosamine--N-acetylmuramyl-(pentapeptide) pyrophosphoryl-undecaprenol N-acetylglucosamine transferase
MAKQFKQTQKIVITGGHHNSALVVAEELRRRGHKVIWFGHRFTMLADRRPGGEYREVTRAGFEFIEIKSGKLSRRNRLVYLLRYPFGFGQSFFYLVKFKPDLIVSFGGHLALPAVICGWLLGIPSVTHEQTVVSGLANRAIGFFAKKIFVSWPSSLKHFPARKVVLTGLPLRPEIFKPQTGIKFKDELPVIYVTGGKQGSHFINQAVKDCLVDLLADYNLIHQSGSSTLYNDFSELKKLKKSLPSKLRQRYLVRDYIFKEEIGAVFKMADLIVGRSGAHTVCESAALGKPAIFIPIPWSRGDEQFKNAQILVKAGSAEILAQEELSGQNLSQLVKKMMTNLDHYRKNALKGKKLIKTKSAEKIADIIEAL